MSEARERHDRRPAPAPVPTAGSTVRVVVDVVGFQAAWWASALTATTAPLLGPVAMLAFVVGHALVTPRGHRAASFLLAALAAVVGLVVDNALVAVGAVAFPGSRLLVGAVPLWMLGLWSGFALTIPSTLATATATTTRAAVLGALAGPVAYVGGARLHALALGPTWSLAVVGVAWAVALPLLATLARACAGLPTTASTLRRRLFSIPAVLLAAAAALVLVPVALPLALLVDVGRAVGRRTPPTVARLVAFMGAYVFGEVLGLLALFLGWWRAGGDDDVLVESTARVQRVWAGTLFAFVRAIFGLRIGAEGLDVVRPGPVFVLIRHASIVDTLLPTVFITGRTGMLLKFVLKRELLADPCLDVAGLRLPNHFVARDGNNSTAEIAAVRALADGLAIDEGVLLYPEGTRFSPARRTAALARVDDPVLHARAEALQHVLPPRPGGVLGLLAADTDADVVFFAHHGLDGLSLFDDLWQGGLVGRTIRLKLWRIRRTAIPVDPAQQVLWLFDRWAEVDAWVGAQVGAQAGAQVGAQAEAQAGAQAGAAASSTKA
jgi:1-acyl-sn-glycerol-3-phosphate acyltransferase